jgi:N-acetylglutamate synthase-like GNAT family acetyltransferase
MKIRKATIKDIRPCASLSKQEKTNSWNEQDFKNCVNNKYVEFLIAEEDGEIIGYALGYISPTKKIEALIHETRVDKRHRGKNIGTKLVKALSDSFFKRKVKVIYAMIEPKLKSFYIDSCKYKETGFWIEASKKR